MNGELLIVLALLAQNLQQVTEPLPVAQAQEALEQIPVNLPKVTLTSLPWTMQKVAQCESGGKHYKAAGKIVRNPVTPDYGVFQINRIHFPEARQLGYDVMTEEGNIKFAMVLYRRNGLRDWTASRQCLAQYGIQV